MKIFLTGMPGSGKSTVLMNVIERLRAEGLSVGGIITPEVRTEGRRTAFKVMDLSSGEEGILASVNQPTGPMVGKYRVNIQDFERVAIPALNSAMRQCQIICIDEIGTMELFSAEFKQKINEILKSEKPLIAVVHRNYAKNYEKMGLMIHVTPENREKIVNAITSKILKPKINH
jgi:nucleoside-triphosphatase